MFVLIAFAALLMPIASRAGTLEIAILAVLFLVAPGVVVQRHRRRTTR
ncbi:hypothetical protein [Streptomyces sp. CO7]